MLSSDSNTSSSAAGVNMSFPIVNKSHIRIGEKVTLKIPRRAKPAAPLSIEENETTQMIKREIESQVEFVRIEEEARSKMVETILRDYKPEPESSVHIEELRAKIQKEIDAIAHYAAQKERMMKERKEKEEEAFRCVRASDFNSMSPQSHMFLDCLSLLVCAASSKRHGKK